MYAYEVHVFIGITYAITLFETHIMHAWYVMCVVCIWGQYLLNFSIAYYVHQFGSCVFVETKGLDYVSWLHVFGYVFI